MGYIPGNHIPIKSIQETTPEYIPGKKSPAGIKQDAEQAGSFTLAEITFSGDSTEFIVLGDMLFQAVIGIMQDITGQLPGWLRGTELNFIMRIDTAPFCQLLIKEPEFAVGIPGPMTDKPATVISTTVHRVPC